MLELQLYKAQMYLVKERLVAVEKILGAKKPRTYSETTDNEFMWLQLRTVVELVAFAGIIADEERYAALRAEAKDNPNYKRDWKAGAILEKLSKISPHFLPIPLGPTVQKPDGLHIESAKERETLERFVFIYETAGQHLHAPNPFSSESNLEHLKRLEESRVNVKREFDYLKAVLWKHGKIGLEFRQGDSPRERGSPMTAWLVDFGSSSSREIRFIEAVAASGQDAQFPPR